MRKFGLLCLALAFLLSVPTALAQTPVPTAVPRGTIISLPANNETVRGKVRIWGSVWDDNFDRYEVRYQVGSAASVFMAGGSQPVINGLLYEWNTTGFKDGVYVIELRAVRKDGNYPKSARVTVRVDNTTPPTPIATPTEGPTSTPEPTRTTLILPASTPQRTATPSPAATPRTEGTTPSSPTISLDATLCLRPLATGGGLVAGFFLLVGLLALIRRLLGH